MKKTTSARRERKVYHKNTIVFKDLKKTSKIYANYNSILHPRHNSRHNPPTIKYKHVHSILSPPLEGVPVESV